MCTYTGQLDVCILVDVYIISVDSEKLEPGGVWNSFKISGEMYGLEIVRVSPPLPGESKVPSPFHFSAESKVRVLESTAKIVESQSPSPKVPESLSLSSLQFPLAQGMESRVESDMFC